MRLTAPALLIGVASLAPLLPTPAQQVEWRHYGADRAHSRFLPLNQVNKSNVKRLQEAWRWESVDAPIAQKNRRLGLGPFKPTPLMVGGMLYVSTSLSQVAAIDPATGKTLWVHDPESYKRPRPGNSGYQHRGVEYWTDGKDARIIIATGGRQLIAINAKTGETYPEFGRRGWVDLRQGLGRPINERTLGFNSPPVVCRDTIVVGSVVQDFVQEMNTAPGHVRGYDVRTGKLKWVFHTIPHPGEFGNETWKDESWKKMGNTNVWSTISADEELGYVYLPVSTPTNDYYGGHRLGDNLFAESLVCLDAETGERVWHFQVCHHGLWDYDIPCGPNLVDLTVDGKPIKAVAQVTKQGFCFVFDRVTGEPVWPIEERPVPASTVPGEEAAGTQPFPTKPPPFERQTTHDDDLIDFTPQLRAEALQIVGNLARGPLYLPPIVNGQGGKQGSLLLPSPAGGANWRGAAVDPETNLLYVGSMTSPVVMSVVKPDPGRSSFDYVIRYLSARGPQGLPLVKPPYGRITAIDLNRGEIAWQVPHGDGPRDHPAIKHLKLGRLGNASNGVLSGGGGFLTKQLYFAIQAAHDPNHAMRMGPTGWLRAWDKTNGDLIWEQMIASRPISTPMTYMHQGKQYIVVGVGGMEQKSQLIAFALPD